MNALRDPLRGKVQLPLVATHARELETCGYCPKLCRATCSVSNALPSESLTPWGKMSLSWLLARGDLARDSSIMEAAWACCGCQSCTDFCQHHNPVSETLLAARANYREIGFVPPRVEQSYTRFRQWLSQDAGEWRTLSARSGASASAPVLLVVGCGYLRQFSEVAQDSIRAAVRLLGPLQVSLECCGLYARQAGDLETAEGQRQRLLASSKGKRLVFADAGCAFEYRELEPTTLVELAASQPERLGRVAELAAGHVRYHDPCRLARGLSCVDAPRTVLGRALGRPPEEFERRGKGAQCSGGGGLLPLSFPEISRSIADDRLHEHERLGGGTIVTGCASSLARFRSRGAKALDIMTVIAQSLGIEAAPG